MTTKKDNYRNNIQQNYENGFNDLKKYNINLNINNNKDNTYFINNLRKYDEKINPRIHIIQSKFLINKMKKILGII